MWPYECWLRQSHHGRQRGGFARARRAHKDAQATLGHGHVFEHLGQAQLVDGGDVGRNRPQHHAHAPLLNEGIHPKASNPGWGDGKVAFLGALELGHLAVAHDGTGQRHGVIGRQRLRRHPRHRAIDLDRGRKFSGDEQVTALAIDHQLQQVVDKFTGLIAFHT